MKGHDLALGQLFLVGFAGLSVDAGHPVVEDITRHGLGGVILFDRALNGERQNIESPAQLSALTATLQRHARTPLLIAVDQEGGRVCRLKEEDGFPPSPPAKLLGDGGDPGRPRRYAEQMAASLAAASSRLAAGSCAAGGKAAVLPAPDAAATFSRAAWIQAWTLAKCRA